MHTIIDYLLANGADLALEINPAETLVFAPWTIMKCLYGCPNYGHNRACPPISPGYEQTKEIASSFGRGVIFRVHKIEEGTPLALAAAAELFKTGFYKVLAFGTGPCRQCEKCLGLECPTPHLSAPSMEACGIDVFATLERAGIDYKPFNKPTERIDCFGLLLID